jgi:serine/threonine protein kinase
LSRRRTLRSHQEIPQTNLGHLSVLYHRNLPRAFLPPPEQHSLPRYQARKHPAGPGRPRQDRRLGPGQAEHVRGGAGVLLLRQSRIHVSRDDPPVLLYPLRAGHTYPVDFYCMGALLYELLVGLPPFYSRDPNEIYESVLSEELTFPEEVALTSECKSLLRGLLCKDAKQRLGSIHGVK